MHRQDHRTDAVSTKPNRCRYKPRTTHHRPSPGPCPEAVAAEPAAPLLVLADHCGEAAHDLGPLARDEEQG
jgi:hypothetical protein